MAPTILPCSHPLVPFALFADANGVNPISEGDQKANNGERANKKTVEEIKARYARHQREMRQRNVLSKKYYCSVCEFIAGSHNMLQKHFTTKTHKKFEKKYLELNSEILKLKNQINFDTIVTTKNDENIVPVK